MSDLFSEYLEKTRQSQVAMWSAVGNVFGFIVSAASVIAAVKNEIPSLTLYVVLLLSFCGISAVMGCFLVQKKEYLRLISELPGIQKMNAADAIEKAQREIAKPSQVMRFERWALFLLWASIISFLIFCLLTFTSP